MQTLHTPSILVGLLLAGTVLLLSSAFQGSIEARRIERTIGSPVKVLGIPAPDEWIDIESNDVGQPATTYTVPDGHRLTLSSIALSPRFPQVTSIGARNMSMRLHVNGMLYLEATGNPGTQINPRDSGLYWVLVGGTVLGAGETVTLERFDDGNTIANPADPAHTFAVRGFLERVE